MGLPRALRRLALATLAVGLLAAAAGGRAQTRVANEAELKAAFVYRIALFAEWPAESLPAAATLQMCLLGNDTAWVAAFTTLEGKKVQGRTVSPPRSLARGEDAHGCHVLFVPEREARRPVVSALGLLTVGESDGFSAAGGVVGFVREGAQLRFDINRDAAARAQLRLPAELLKVARNVIDGGGPRP